MKLPLLILCLTAYTAAALDWRRAKGAQDSRITQQRFGIEGGQLIDIEKRPYTVALVTNVAYIGTGTLIHKNWVLTAATYKLDLKVPGSTVRVASRNAFQGGQLIGIEKAVVHPGYNGTWVNDLMLLKLNKPVQISKKVKPISLASTLPEQQENMIASGYGSVDYSYKIDGLLREAEIFYTPYKTCLHYIPHQITPKSFCSESTKTGACIRDWGAPSVYNESLIGIFSGFQIECSSRKHPGVYADITQFRKWIMDTISH